jgi:membrane-bound serine protease (ClpP class)
MCCGRVLRHFIFLLLLLLLAGQAYAAPVSVLKLQDAIGPASADYVIRGIHKAAQAGAPLVVIELDTPGGLDTSMRQIIQEILASPVPVAIYVSPEGARAASAGTYMMYAAHIAAMAPATTLGAATPVAIGLPGSERKPKDEDGAKKPASAASSPFSAITDTMSAKQVHDAAAFIRGLAQLRGRNADWAERAVREAVSLTAGEALQSKVIDVVARDVPDLLAQIDGRSVHVQTRDVRLATRGAQQELHLPDWRQRLLSVIAHPSVALMFMMFGIWGLFFEFAAPGHGVSGVTGAICLLIAAFALQLLPVNYAAVALVLLGVGLLVAEMFVPSFGVLGIGGVAALVAGGLMLVDTDMPGFGVPPSLVLLLAAASVAIIALGSGLALRTRGKPVVSGRENMAGTTGHILETGGAETWAEVLGERWKVASKQPLKPGQRIRVVASRGLTLEVQPDPIHPYQGSHTK